MLSQQHRRTIHQKLAPIVGEEEVDAMLSEFPASEGDAPATRADLEAQAFVTRADLAATRADLEAQAFVTRADFTVLRAEVDANLAGLRAEMHDLGRQMVMWSTGSVIVGMGLAATIGALFGG